jgi:polyhydroxybutyrate depolymerase
MKKPHRITALSCLLFTAALACARPALTASHEPTGQGAGESIRFLMHGGRERSYILYIPDSVDPEEPAALVFIFHGGMGNAESAVRMSTFHGIADRNGLIVVYPNGTGRLSDETLLTWNGGACCGYAQEEAVDDVGFVRAMVEDVRSMAAIDARRIYASGMSNGGILSHRLGCEAADLFAAIAPVAGTLNYSPCNPAKSVSVIEFHGTQDQHILYDGGYGPQSIAQADFTSVKYSIGFWSSFNRCDPEPQTEESDGIRHDVWTGCADSAAVELYTVIGGGHAWPGGPGDTAVSDVSASELIWAFFDAHPKP